MSHFLKARSEISTRFQTLSTAARKEGSGEGVQKRLGSRGEEAEAGDLGGCQSLGGQASGGSWPGGGLMSGGQAQEGPQLGVGDPVGAGRLEAEGEVVLGLGVVALVLIDGGEHGERRGLGAGVGNRLGDGQGILGQREGLRALTAVQMDRGEGLQGARFAGAVAGLAVQSQAQDSASSR
jgi:hypothetical protein